MSLFPVTSREANLSLLRWSSGIGGSGASTGGSSGPPRSRIEHSMGGSGAIPLRRQRQSLLGLTLS